MCSSKNSSLNFKKGHIFFLLLSFLLLSFIGFEEQNYTLSLTFAGDAIPHYMIRSIIDYKREKGIFEAFYFLRKYLKSDISFFNLETTITDKPKPVRSYHFSVEPIFLTAILKTGFTHYTVANNHSLDFGKGGFEETLNFIDKDKCTGFSEDGKISYLLININGFKIAFFSFTTLSNYQVDPILKYKPVYIENCFTNKSLLELIEELDKEADLLITGIHWGNEYQFYPDQNQKKIARFLIDKGVDIIWGTHPHVIQPFEIYNNKLILYSCGNLISGQAYNVLSKEKTDFHENYFYTRAIPIIKVYLNKEKQIFKIELIPFFQINNYFIRKKDESYFTTLLPTKYFIKNIENYQTMFINFLQNDEDLIGGQDFQNKGEIIYFIDYIKKNLLDKNCIKNMILSNNAQYNNFFSLYLNDNNQKIDNKLFQKIEETDYSYIFIR